MYDNIFNLFSSFFYHKRNFQNSSRNKDVYEIKLQLQKDFDPICADYHSSAQTSHHTEQKLYRQSARFVLIM